MDTAEKEAEKEKDTEMDTSEKEKGGAGGGSTEKGGKSEQHMEEGEIQTDAAAGGEAGETEDVLADYHSSEEDGADDSDDSLIRDTMRNNPSLLAGAQDGDGDEYETVSD